MLTFHQSVPIWHELVLAGQIGHGGNLSKSADEILHTSFYAVTENDHGCPSGYGILLTFKLNGWYDVIQIYFGYSSKIASYRIHQTGWGQWINLN